jgi:hypothetical protein
VVMERRKLKIYIDTSVIGGYYDEEFETETRLFFEEVKQGKFQIIYSSVTEDELLGAPQKVRNVINEILNNNVTKVELTEEAVALADAYIIENVVGKTSREDCFHIAIATLQQVDILLSWNFKHIVNYNRIRGYYGVNMKLGYPTIDIRSPKEIIYNEED